MKSIRNHLKSIFVCNHHTIIYPFISDNKNQIRKQCVTMPTLLQFFDHLFFFSLMVTFIKGLFPVVSRVTRVPAVRYQLSPLRALALSIPRLSSGEGRHDLDQPNKLITKQLIPTLLISYMKRYNLKKATRTNPLLLSRNS